MANPNSFTQRIITSSGKTLTKTENEMFSAILKAGYRIRKGELKGILKVVCMIRSGALKIEEMKEGETL